MHVWPLNVKKVKAYRGISSLYIILLSERDEFVWIHKVRFYIIPVRKLSSNKIYLEYLS